MCKLIPASTCTGLCVEVTSRCDLTEAAWHDSDRLITATSSACDAGAVHSHSGQLRSKPDAIA